MARKKSIDTIESEITKVRSEMTRLQDRYEKLGEQLKALQEEKRRHEADAIMDAYLKSGKSLYDVMTFLNP